MCYLRTTLIKLLMRVSQLVHHTSYFRKCVAQYKYFLSIIIIIIYHDFLPTPRRGSHVKSGKTHTQSSKIHPLAYILDR